MSATIEHFTTFQPPIDSTALDIHGWDGRRAITEVTYETYLAIRAAGHVEADERDDAHDSEPGGTAVARRILDEAPLADGATPLDIPDELADGTLAPQPSGQPTYVESNQRGPITSPELPDHTQGNTERNRLIEQRAVGLVRQAVEAQGWILERDCQKDGVGYDLHYRRGARDLHVEVKGIAGSALAFNITPKESWRIETDPAFVVIAVTSALSPKAFRLQLLTRTDLITADRVITGYRLTFRP